MKVVIVGGVAGGASCAARLRRLDEKAKIVMVERGPYVSYANCGLPYHVGGVIEKIEPPGRKRASFARPSRSTCGRTAGVSIAADKKTVDLRNVATGEVTTESYDKLVLLPGAPRCVRRCPASTSPGSSSQDRT